MFRAQEAHRLFFDPTEVQIATLLSIKTGGCPEDCAYCPQSAHYETGAEGEKLMAVEGGRWPRRVPREALGRDALLHGRGLALARRTGTSTPVAPWSKASRRSGWRPASPSAC